MTLKTPMKVWSSQSYVELGKPFSCTECLTVWISQCKVTWTMFVQTPGGVAVSLMSSWEAHVPYCGSCYIDIPVLQRDHDGPISDFYIL